MLTAYLVANAIILPAGAYMTTFIGRKKFCMICVALFGISNAQRCAGLAASLLPMLLFFRVLQGLGGGGLAPLWSRRSLADTFPPSSAGRRSRRMGCAVVCAPAIGPTLGGYITDHFQLAVDLLPGMCRARCFAVAVSDLADRGRSAVCAQAGG